MNFTEKCVRVLFETANAIKFGINVFDDKKSVEAGAILGSQVSLLIDFIRENQGEEAVKNVMSVIEKENSQMKEKFKKMLTENNPTLRYIG